MVVNYTYIILQLIKTIKTSKKNIVQNVGLLRSKICLKTRKSEQNSKAVDARFHPEQPHVGDTVAFMIEEYKKSIAPMEHLLGLPSDDKYDENAFTESIRKSYFAECKDETEKMHEKERTNKMLESFSNSDSDSDYDKQI
uniref:Uncharacterized protein n=1 Tax=Rhizophagus irregularis (strain DAOM 181602 / DAOM 197198 / MUCL 43194) TaxID=747089 RepID=U9UWC8_RHIID